MLQTPVHCQFDMQMISLNMHGTKMSQTEMHSTGKVTPGSTDKSLVVMNDDYQIVLGFAVSIIMNYQVLRQIKTVMYD